MLRFHYTCYEVNTAKNMQACMECTNQNGIKDAMNCFWCTLSLSSLGLLFSVVQTLVCILLANFNLCLFLPTSCFKTVVVFRKRDNFAQELRFQYEHL